MSIIKSLKSVAIASLAILIPSIALAAGGNLEPNDPVGITFWLISIAMVAATVFFLMESLRVDGKWRTSMIVGGLVTLVAAVHYFYMRDVWVATGASPTVFRYVDWLITVPLQMIEFYLILAACTAIAVGVFWRLMIGTMVMLIGGYLGEAGFHQRYGWFRDRNGRLGIYICMKSLLVKLARLLQKVHPHLCNQLSTQCV